MPVRFFHRPLPTQRKAYSSSLILAAADTILASVLTFFLAMLHAPEVVAKAQAELDKVTGGIRLPTFADRPALPYITAIAKEALRWESVIPMGVPHVVKQDDVSLL